MFDIFLRPEALDRETHFVATYDLEGATSLRDAAWELAIGQSVGNPHVRNEWETDELFECHSCKVLGDEEELRRTKRGIVQIAFPVTNTNWREDGVTQLLVQVMGGQLDISDIKRCRLLDIAFPPAVTRHFKGPKFGARGVREFLGIGADRPVLGGIIKPKTGISPGVLLEMVKQLVEGGVNFIKEDEILSNPSFCPIEVRVPMIMDYIRSTGRKVIYAVCINADFPHVLDRVRRVHELGGNAVHINFWNGLGVYRAVRELDLPIFVHFQKSGDKILTDASHRFSIDFAVVCQLAGMMGVDFIHAGMWGGYSATDDDELCRVLNALRAHDVLPALSCGMHPGIVNAIVRRFGPEFMANTGGAIHGHPGGSRAGAFAMRQAIDGDTDAAEYRAAIARWGLVE